MGLNSYNRFSNILPSSVKEEYTRDAKVENSSIIDESYFENISACPDCSNILESLSLIEEDIRDIRERYSEQRLSVTIKENIIPNYSNQPECTKARYNIISDIKNDIANIFIVAKESVRQAGLRFNNIAMSILESDKSAYEKYIKAIDENSLEGYSGIKNFLFPNEFTNEAMKELSVYNSLSVIKSINNTNCLSESSCDFGFDPVEFVKENFEADNIWFPDSIQMSILKGFVSDGKSSVTKSIVNATESTIKNLDNMKDEVFNILSELKYTESDFDRSIIVFEDVCREYIKPLLMKFNTFLDLEGMEIASYRRALISTGRYALGINESEEVEQVIGESSDAYIFDMFNN